MNCDDVDIRYILYQYNPTGSDRAEPERRIYPASTAWPCRSFVYAPAEAISAYTEACALFSVHTGAAGAYVRRALELILDGAGYGAKSLADSIKLASSEKDADRRLPRRLLLKLDYIREIGNFALHIRRDDELTIVEISEEEVSACLETVEDLVAYLFEEPVEEYLRTVEVNRKLVSAGKKAIELPPLPPGVTAESLAS